MKKLIVIFCFILICALALGCSDKNTTQEPGNMQLGNPWNDYNTLPEAETAAGINFGIPETIGDYTACSFRVMSNSLLEVTYKYGDFEVTVRKQSGEGQDISGDYTQYPNVTDTDTEGGCVTVRTNGTAVSAIISCDGYSWSLYSPVGLSEELQDSFISAIFR